MKKFILSIAMLAMTAGMATAQVADNGTFLIPTAKSVKAGKGVAALTVQAKVDVNDKSLNHAAGYLKQSLHIVGAPRGEETANVELQIVKNKKLGNEGYTMNVTEDKIVITGQTPQAVMWGIQTLLQIQDAQDVKGKFEVPVCQIEDQPDYRMRGFMIDVARKFIPMDYLKNLVRTMSYYKMNMLQIHLNDNGFKKYFHNNWDETYSAFRLESERFPELTAKDGHYTKDEFRQFVKESAKMGVEIIPEIDVPAHSLAFTHFRPSLGAAKFGVDHLDLTNPEVIPFVDSLFIEYMEGPDPVFAGPRVHIGTDEYSNADKKVVELFRSFTNHLILLVEKYGYQAKLWGSLTHAKGETPVKSENVIMDVWNNGFANPKDMKEQGFQMVSINDGHVYIVPAAGYYYDYLNCRFLYERWTPAKIGNVQFEEKDPQIEGGCFAVWNDVCGNGISVGDVHHRTFPALQVIAQKCWHAVNDTVNYAKWDKARKSLGEGPGMNELGTTEANIPILRSNSFLRGGKHHGWMFRYDQIGYDYQVDFNITWDKEKPGTVLTESGRAKFYLSDPISGMIGFSRDGYLFTFKYSGRPGVTEKLTIKGTNKKTELWVNGKLFQTLNYDERLAADKKPYNVVRTLVFPLWKTGNFKSAITNFKAQKL